MQLPGPPYAHKCLQDALNKQGTLHALLYMHHIQLICTSHRLNGVSTAERSGFSARAQRNFRAGGRGSSVRIRFENGGNQKANFVRNNAKGSRNTPQGSFEISL